MAILNITLNKQNKYENKIIYLASLLAVFNLNAIEIGPTGSGVELGGLLTMRSHPKMKRTNPISTAQVELNLDYSTGPVSFSLIDLTSPLDGDDDGVGF